MSKAFAGGTFDLALKAVKRSTATPIGAEQIREIEARIRAEEAENLQRAQEEVRMEEEEKLKRAEAKAIQKLEEIMGITRSRDAELYALIEAKENEIEALRSKMETLSEQG